MVNRNVDVIKINLCLIYSRVIGLWSYLIYPNHIICHFIYMPPTKYREI